jgi:hypothetical protein
MSPEVNPTAIKSPFGSKAQHCGFKNLIILEIRY